MEENHANSTFSVVDDIKETLNRECINLKNSKKNRVIRLLLSCLYYRKAKGYSASGAVLYAFGSLTENFNRRIDRQSPKIDLTELTGLALYFGEISDDESTEIQSFLENLLPQHPKFSEFINQKLGIETERFGLKLNGDLRQLKFVLMVEADVCSDYDESFRFNSASSIDLSEIAEEFCTAYEFSNFTRSEIEGFYTAKKPNKIITIGTSSMNGQVLVSLKYS